MARNQSSTSGAQPDARDMSTHARPRAKHLPDDIGVGADGRLDLLGVFEMHDAAVVAEEVNLLDARNVVHTQALQGILQALVICAGCFVHSLFLPSHRALATGSNLRPGDEYRAADVRKNLTA